MLQIEQRKNVKLIWLSTLMLKSKQNVSARNGTFLCF